MPRYSPVLLIALLAAMPAAAQPVPRGADWGGEGWNSADGRQGWGAQPSPRDSRLAARQRRGEDSREGQVRVTKFVAEDAGDALGHGKIAVQAMAGTTPEARDQATYEAALVDQLVKAGYDTATPDPKGWQVLEIRIVRDVLRPEEQKRNPVSGEVMVGASNHGTMTGMALNLDFTKPKKALLSIKLEARIRDRVTDKPLWEGRAEIATREGDKHWDETQIANRLAAALFEKFPQPMTDGMAR